MRFSKNSPIVANLSETWGAHIVRPLTTEYHMFGYTYGRFDLIKALPRLNAVIKCRSLYSFDIVSIEAKRIILEVNGHKHKYVESHDRPGLVPCKGNPYIRDFRLYSLLIEFAETLHRSWNRQLKLDAIKNAKPKIQEPVQGRFL